MQAAIQRSSGRLFKNLDESQSTKKKRQKKKKKKNFPVLKTPTFNYQLLKTPTFNCQLLKTTKVAAAAA